MSHKEIFQRSPFSKGWSNTIDGAQFQMAADMAMLHFQASFPIADDMGTAAANEWRRQGAIAFLNILKELNINANPPTAKSTGQLIHA